MGVLKWSIRSGRFNFAAAYILIMAIVPSSLVRAQDQPITRYTFSDLADQVIPSVVTVDIKKEVPRRNTSEMIPFPFDQFFDPFNPQWPQDNDPNNPNQPTPKFRYRGEQSSPEEDNRYFLRGSGSGVIISEDGYIVTNSHVVGLPEDELEISIVFSDETELSGDDVKLVYSNELIDLAILKVNKTGLKPIKWGDSDKVRIGEAVVALGSPLALRHTVSQGIVCAKHRSLGIGLGDKIQIDAVINPGSSGGALVNLDGELIGINQIITTPASSGRWEGFGFAISSKDVKYFADRVITEGSVSYGYIGILIRPLESISDEMLKALGFEGNTKQGAYVMSTTPGQPADKAGIQVGDIILEANGTPVKDSTDLVDTIARSRVGSTVMLKVMRDVGGNKAEQLSIPVEIATRPEERNLTIAQNGMNAPSTPKTGKGNLGLMFKESEEGLVITEVQQNSPAAKAGLRSGDLVTALNRVEVKSYNDFKKALDARKEGRPHLIAFKRDGATMLAPIKE